MDDLRARIEERLSKLYRLQGDDDRRPRRKMIEFTSETAHGPGPFYAPLSDDFMRQLPSINADGDLLIHDSLVDRLTLRIRDGRITFNLTYPDARSSEMRRIVLGNASQLSVDEARLAAIAQMETDLVEGPPRRKPRRARCVTVAEAVRAYGKESVAHKSENHARRQRSLLQLLVEKHGDQKVSTLKRRALVGFTSRIAIVRPSKGHELHKAIKAWLSWCVAEGVIEANLLSRARPPLRPERHVCCLSPQEIVRIYASAEELGAPWAQMVKLLILTGENIETIRHLRLDQIDLPRERWSPDPGLPWESPHQWTPLPRTYVEILSRLSPAGEYLFALPRGGQRKKPAYLRPSILRRLQDAAKVSGWTWRDLVNSARSASHELEWLQSNASAEAIRSYLSHIATGAVDDESVVL